MGGFLPYKGLNKLIEGYLDSPCSLGSSFWIGGLSDKESTAQIEARIAADDRIEFSQGFIDDEHLELQVKAADWVVLPYSNCFNSGVAIYALSCGTRALVPDTPVMREMENLTQFPSFEYFSDNKFREVLDSIFRAGRIEDPTPNTSVLDPENFRRKVCRLPKFTVTEI